MHTHLRVLVVEDSITVQKMVQKMLHPRSGVDFEIQECVNLTDAQERLRRLGADVVILDLTLPESTGVETVSRVREIDKDIPIVVFTGCEDDNLAVAAMHLGADDFLVKREVRQGSLLARTLIYAVEKKKARIALDKYAMEMERLAEDRARQLLHQDRLATIGTMSAGVAHEIKNPLSYIAGNTHALETSWLDLNELLDTCRRKGLGDGEEIGYLQEEVPKMLGDILGGVERIVEICDGLKSFARKSNKEPVVSCLEDLIDNSLLLCHNQLKYGVAVEKNYGTKKLALAVQPQMLLQVFINLVTNAAQAMDGKGRLVLGTTVQDDQVVVTLSDSGPGISEDVLERIWEPFFTTKPEDQGTGLGLSISRTIIEEHGGTLDVANLADGGGACFTISIPLSPTNRRGERAAVTDPIETETPPAGQPLLQ